MVRRRRNSGSETMPPKKLRSPVSFGIFSKRNRGTFFFAACLANPELRLKHLRAPRDRPRHARHATEVLFLLRYSRVPAAGAGPPWLLRLLRARSKGSRRHAAPRVGISDRGIISGVPHHRKRSPSPGPNRPVLTENSPLDCFPGVRTHYSGEARRARGRTFRRNAAPTRAFYQK